MGMSITVEYDSRLPHSAKNIACDVRDEVRCRIDFLVKRMRSGRMLAMRRRILAFISESGIAFIAAQRSARKRFGERVFFLSLYASQ